MCSIWRCGTAAAVCAHCAAVRQQTDTVHSGQVRALVGVAVLKFYDDFLWAAEQKRAQEAAEWVKWFLPASSWLLNDKCQWEPQHLHEFLGFDVNSRTYTVHVTEARMARAICCAQQRTLRSRH